ncbi:CLASP N terminal [Phytophthora infestans]|uniref:CLASP N terminal n=1 Tax=Phytophthora infestans TaxID=4787 RepID=A0A8S9V1B0_PHYIN|nr:CLASP N terminal [Phytophthora infestans]
MRGDQRTDMSLMTFGGKTNAVLELGKRLIQPEEEWKDKCAAFTELRALLSDASLLQSKLTDAPETAAVEDCTSIFTIENVQALTQPFRVTLTDLRSTVVKEACATLSHLAQALGPLRCKILVRDVFPTLLDARGGSNKVNTAAIHSCIEAIMQSTPSRFVLAPVLQVLNTSKNREVRQSCIHYTYLALEGWNSAILERFRVSLQSAIATSLSDASPKGREKARDCYWKYIAIWPDEADRINDLLADGVKKHLKRSRKEAGLDTSLQTTKRRHLATITNTLSLKNTAKSQLTGHAAAHTKKTLKHKSQRVTSRAKTGEKGLCSSCDKKMTPPSSGSKVPSTLERLHRNDVPTPASGIPLPSLIPSTPTSALKKPREGRMPSKIPTPPRTVPATDLLEKETPTLEGKLAQLQEEKACLAKQITAQAHELHQLRGRIQKMNEEKQLSESRHKVAMAATMEAHAQDSATQQDIQYKLAEQLGAQEEELEELRSQHSQSSSPTQTTSQTPDHVAHLENELSLLSEQLEVATSKLGTSSAEAGGEMNALRSEKCALEERLSAQSMQLEELQAKQSAKVAALEEEKRMLADEVSSLKNIETEVMARCNEKDDRVAQLESELSLLSEQLEVATSKLETSSAEAGGEMNALRSEKCALEERLSAQSMQLEELQAKQSATVAALEEEKRMLADEVSSLKNIETEVMARCNEKDDRVAQLESELSLLSEQLEVATSKLETSSAEAGGEMNALRSEKCALEERLSAQSMQLEELQAKQSATVAALEEEKRMLADEVSSLKNIETEVMARCNEKDDRVAQLESELSLLSEQLEVATSKLETSSAEAGGEMNALRSQKCALEERLSAQSMQLEELQAKQSATVAALEEEKRMLADEVSSLKNIETEVMARCNEKDDRVAQLESELSLLSEQLEVATSKLETSSAEAGGEMNALRSEKCALEERLSAQSMQLKELQAKQSATVAALEEEKRMLADEVSSLKNIETEVMARCNEKDDRVAQLESELSLLSEQLEVATSKLETSSADAGGEMNALRSEKCALKERLSAQSMQLEELQAKQSATVAALEEEKRMLADEVSSKEHETEKWCNLRVGDVGAEAGGEMNVFGAGALEERLSAQSMQLEELLVRNRVLQWPRWRSEKRMLADEVSSKKNIETESSCGSGNPRVETSSAEAGGEMNALRSEKCALEERLSVLKYATGGVAGENRVLQWPRVARRRMLADEVSLKNIETEVMKRYAMEKRRPRGPAGE